MDFTDPQLDAIRNNTSGAANSLNDMESVIERNNGNVYTGIVSSGGGVTALLDYAGSNMLIMGALLDIEDTSAADNDVAFYFDPDTGTNFYFVRLELDSGEHTRIYVPIYPSFQHLGSGDIMVSLTGAADFSLIVFGVAG